MTEKCPALQSAGSGSAPFRRRTGTGALAVRCTTQVDILPEQVWKITFTYQWDAVAGHPAGKAAFVDIGGLADDNFDQMPYILPLPQGNG